MGSGAGGVYSRTWGSADDAQSREKLLSAIEMAAGAFLGDSVVELAEALLRVAAGEPVEDVDFPEVSDVAFDLALDALSAFSPGGAAATRSLGAAARAAGKVGKGSAKVVEKRASKVHVDADEEEKVEEFFGPAFPGIGAKPPKGDAQLKHIFRKKHNWSDTPENRRRLEELVSRPQNFRGVDRENGHAWYSDPEFDLPQIWAEVRDNTISDAGINEALPEWDEYTGMRSNPRKNGTYRKGKRKA